MAEVNPRCKPGRKFKSDAGSVSQLMLGLEGFLDETGNRDLQEQSVVTVYIQTALSDDFYKQLVQTAFRNCFSIQTTSVSSTWPSLRAFTCRRGSG